MVQANGLRFRVMADGPSTGELVMMLHGFPEGAESWANPLHALAREGALAIAPDMRGYGLTDAPPNVDDYAMSKLVEDVRAIIGAFGRTAAHVAGHDWGGMVAWFFAIEHPEMTRSLTVLSVGHPAALAGAMREPDQRTRSRYIDLFLLEGKAERVLEEDGHRRLRAMFGDSVPPSDVEHFVRSLSRPGRLTAALNYYRANLSGEEPWRALRTEGRIAAATTLLWGDSDPALGRAQAEETAAYMTGEYRLVVLEGAGHWLQYERPGEVVSSLAAALSK
jgi:pimeloyl-ACP methyl ester carboxylesterase